MQALRSYFPFIFAMCAIVALSNYLVQFPVQASIGGLNLGDLLTWGAFTYPVAFLVTDLTNRRFGSSAARVIVFCGFVLAVALSALLASPRIAIASGTAFLAAQLLDVSVFDRLRHSAWWKAPLVSSVIGSVLDTFMFFSIAFAGFFAVFDFGGERGSLDFPVPFLGFGSEVPLWVSLAAGDLVVKLIVGVAMLLPYGALRGVVTSETPAAV
ncbi:queuosine precursor transporter [Oricola cellulosilytica]|uniref:Probable queuosine precursor transporter n=1 Tax=Oricola cellulosilytica TaxID=1429082 RepID=A0A4R0PEF7_9HYPH|nr:queuosine precursor transporter [Oricola cellulosilytica]TCD13753.1 VUT family protein [Oricola cellulosilytica]